MAKLNCSKCGELKTGSYVKESWCSKCVNARRAELRIERRKEKDLPAYGSGRDPKCKKCRILKEPKYQGGPWCKACKCANEKARYEAKKLAEGSPKRIVNRNTICKCGVTKEHKNDAFCVKCTTEKRHERKRKRDMDPEHVKKERAEKAAIFNNAAHRRKKRLCRAETRRLEAKKLLKRLPCERCGITDTVVPHHVDYNDPWNVIWLCSVHHTEIHVELRKLDKENK